MDVFAKLLGSLLGLALVLAWVLAGVIALAMPLMVWSLARSARRIAVALEAISERPAAPVHEDKAATGLRFHSR